MMTVADRQVPVGRPTGTGPLGGGARFDSNFRPLPFAGWLDNKTVCLDAEMGPRGERYGSRFR